MGTSLYIRLSLGGVGVKAFYPGSFRRNYIVIQEGLGRCKASLMPTSLFEAAATTYRRAEGSPQGRLSPKGRAVTNLGIKGRFW